MDDFDARMKKMRKQHERFSRFVFALIAISFLATLVGIGSIIYFGVTTSPEDIGAFFGRIVAGYENGATQ